MLNVVSTDQVLEMAGKILDVTMMMELQLSENEVDYDLPYICQKLAQCSVFMERLSDAHMKLTQISVGTKNKLYRAQGLLKIGKKDAEMNGDYEKLMKLEVDVAEWNHARRMVEEVRDAVKDRAQLMKRLDSDIRLHQRLLEDKVKAGASTGIGYQGKTADDLNL